MDKIKIIGGKQLNGKIYISGAKNAALPLICASLLTEQPVVLKNTPQLSDITFLNSLLEYMGLKISVADVDCGGYKSKTYTYKADEIKELVAPYDFVRKMRASYYVLGPLLTRFKHVEFSLPGGCAIGARPIDIHLSSLEQMGASIEIKNGYVIADAPKGLKGAHIIFSKASVGATCNILMAATLAKGVTKIENAAKEPEITDLIDLLNSMGAKIFGRGTSILTIEGVDKLNGAEHSILSDRIEAGSYAIAAAITKGKIELVNARAEHLQQPLRVLEKMGISIKETDNSIIVNARNKTIVGEDIYTDYYPGFPTDLQAQYMALMTVAEGASMVTESIWENRFMHVPELCRMGANINIHGHASAIVRGVKKLSGAQVMATDLRASFALVLAGLVAEGETIVNRIYHLDRGYEKLEEKLKSVGANIERIKNPD
ncbi:MAG: UDP-N-acetylglucosamine 1-carboxyvinyltransferase [Alphaproteobacteria bacterium]|nr:UDP-N-acetylglucosamine 1-carboxyvinyltransferase [Alphaproteobacteria bacterium]